MTIELTEKERTLAEAGEDPPTSTLPGTDTRYVLIRADVYERLRAVVDGMTERAGWDDPALDDYERYRKT